MATCVYYRKAYQVVLPEEAEYDGLQGGASM